MSAPDYLSFGYALVVLTGGIMGYMKAGEDNKFPCELKHVVCIN